MLVCLMERGMKYIVLLFMITYEIFAIKVHTLVWEKGKTFSQYLERHHILVSMLKSMSADDIKFLSDITSRYSYYEMIDDNGTLLQALIPISEVMQIHFVKNSDNAYYSFDIIPIEYERREYFAHVIVENNPYSDTLDTVHNEIIAKRLSLSLNTVLDSRKFFKGDTLDFVYTQDTRVGQPYLMSDIKVVRVKRGRNEKFIYVDEDGNGFAKIGKNIKERVKGKKRVSYMKKVPISKESARFGMPLRRARITSSFSYSRYHPILHRYRPHHGTDFGARRGTPLLAVNRGRISFAGRIGSYGNVVKIRHGGGYESLYAHQSRIRVKRGEKVKKGDIIGYVGSTGRSTGPHLHLGLKKHGRWIDPMNVLGKKSLEMMILKKFTKYEDTSTIRYKTVEIKGAKANKMKLLNYIKNNTSTHVWDEVYHEG